MIHSPSAPAKRAASFNPLVKELRRQFGEKITDDPQRLARVSMDLSLLIGALDELELLYDDGYPAEEIGVIFGMVCRLQRDGVKFDDGFISCIRELSQQIIGTDDDGDADASDESLDLEDSDEDQDDPDEDGTDLCTDNELYPRDPGPSSPEFRRMYGLTNPGWWDEQCEVIRRMWSAVP